MRCEGDCVVFKYYIKMLQTHTQGHTSNMAMLHAATNTKEHTNSFLMFNVWILGSLTYHNAHHYATYTTIVCINVLIQMKEFYDMETSYISRSFHRQNLQIPRK